MAGRDIGAYQRQLDIGAYQSDPDAGASGAISGTASISMTASGTATGVGALSGSASATLSAAATLAATGALVGTAPIALSATGTLLGVGGLSGAASLSMSASGTLNEGVTISIATTRTSGVAPMNVHFDATGTTASGVSRPFHHLHYRWDWDDSNETYSKGKTGPIAVHVFDQPGSYTVTLTVTDPLTGASASDTVDITVTDADTVFAGTDTVCVSTSGTFTGAPSGATQVTSSDFDSVMTTHYASGKRVLFRRGETFVASAGVTLDSDTGASLIGAFGTGTSPDARGIFTNNPIIDVQHTASVIQVGSTDDECNDLRVMDLEFDPPASSAGRLFSLGYRGDDLLFYRIRAAGFSQMYGFGHETPDFFSVDICAGLCIANCDHPSGTQYGAYFSARDGAVLNSLFHSITTEHLLRFPFNERLVVSGCDFDDAESDKHSIKLHSKDYSTAADTTSHVVISDNTFVHNTAWCVGVGSASASQDNRVEDVLIERNDFDCKYRDTAYPVPLTIWNKGTTIRNNRFLVTDATSLVDVQCIRVEQRGTITPDPEDIEVYHNTLYTSESLTGDAELVSVADYGTGNCLVRNNLLYCPNATTTTMTSGVSITASNNLEDTDPSFVSGTDWSLQSGSAAIGYGTAVPVGDDFDSYAGNTRDSTTPDAGAFEFDPATAGAISGDATLGVSAAGTLTGLGELAGAATFGLTASATLLAPGDISGSTTLALSGSGTLTAVGALSGGPSFSISASGTLTGVGALAGNATLSMTARAHNGTAGVDQSRPRMGLGIGITL